MVAVNPRAPSSNLPSSNPASSRWSSSSRDIPVVILAGSDLMQGPVPSEAKELHFLVAYKGAELRVEGRSLAQHLVERVRASGAFGEVYLAGPRRVFCGLVDCTIIDTDGHVGQNIQAAVHFVQTKHGSDVPIAFLACDILPGPRELAEIVSQLVLPRSGREEKGGGEPFPALAISLVTAAEELGAATWKPRYRVRTSRGEEAVPFLPGHFGVAWPSCLRMGLLYRLFSLAYQERNRDYSRRPRVIFLRILGNLLLRDALNLFRLQAPTLTYNIVRHGLGTWFRWRRAELDLEGLAFGLGAVFVRRKHFRRWGSRSVRVITTKNMSFAKDVDTREEFEELLKERFQA